MDLIAFFHPFFFHLPLFRHALPRLALVHQQPSQERSRALNEFVAVPHTGSPEGHEGLGLSCWSVSSDFSCVHFHYVSVFLWIFCLISLNIIVIVELITVTVVLFFILQVPSKVNSLGTCPSQFSQTALIFTLLTSHYLGKKA